MRGRVQGVGFRPFVARAARALGLDAGSRVLVFRDGRIVADGPPAEVL